MRRISPHIPLSLRSRRGLLRVLDRHDRKAQLHPRSRRPRAQPQRRGRRHSARAAGGDDGPVGVGQVIAGVRHHLRRRAAPLRREPVGLCAPVPGADGQAGRGLDRGPVAGHFHRAEDDLQEPALHRRHGHGDPRLHAPALGARGRALLAGHRTADREPDDQPDGGQADGLAGRRAHSAAGARGAGPQGRVPQGTGRVATRRLPAGQDRRRVLCDRGCAYA